MISPDEDNEIFRLASDFINQTSKHLFLTGKAGTGKTTFLRYISEQSHKNVVVAAPTGVAAINAGGVTLHSLFQLPFEPFIPNQEIKRPFRFGQAKIDLLKSIDVLIIDEVSMLRADMLDAVDATLRFVRRNSKPFGGVQMLYIGDMFQLPPVVKDEEWEILRNYYTTPFFFHAKSIERTALLYLELKKVYRQKEQEFVDLLNRVRNNDLSSADLQQLNARYIPKFDPKDEKYIILTTHNYQADQINVKKLDELKGEVVQYKGNIRGEYPDYALPTDLTLSLKIGAQVMFLSNDTEGNYYNGMLAEVVELEDEGIGVKPEGSDEMILVGKEQWKNVKYTLNKEKNEIEEEELGVFVQYPLRTAWAITIHKSQGLTFDKAIIEIGQAFAAGQAYVALSRCTSLEGIVLQSPISANSVRTDQHAVAFSQNERPVDQLEEILSKEKHIFWVDHLLNYFDWSQLLIMLNQHKGLCSEKKTKEFQSAYCLFDALFKKAISQEQIARRFQEQLRVLVMNSDDEISVIKERCAKAVEFFYKDLFSNILAPIQAHINGFTPSKAKSYFKELDRLEDNIIQFINRLTTIIYNNENIVDGLELPIINKTKNIFSIKPKSTKSKGAKGDTKKVQTKEVSLNLFNEGKTISEIAKERSLAESTIMGHLIQMIKEGKLDVEKLVSKDKVEKIKPLIEEIDDPKFSIIVPIKEKLGMNYTYDDIKAVWNHLNKQK